MITDGFTYVAVLLFMAGALVTLGVWDLGQTKAAYGALKNNLTYAMICYGADGLCGGHASGGALRQTDGCPGLILPQLAQTALSF